MCAVLTLSLFHRRHTEFSVTLKSIRDISKSSPPCEIFTRSAGRNFQNGRSFDDLDLDCSKKL